jgi:hypothetical protein
MVTRLKHQSGFKAIFLFDSISIGSRLRFSNFEIGTGQNIALPISFAIRRRNDSMHNDADLTWRKASRQRNFTARLHVLDDLTYVITFVNSDLRYSKTGGRRISAAYVIEDGMLTVKTPGGERGGFVTAKGAIQNQSAVKPKHFAELTVKGLGIADLAAALESSALNRSLRRQLAQ